MQLETRIDTLAARARRIGLSLNDLADKAGMAASTLHRLNAGKQTNPNLSTLQRANDALVHEEISLRDYLNALHPTNLASLAAE